MFTMLAEVDVISGGAGWAGAGLLGLLLGWLLLKHLPAKDAQLENLMGKHALQIDSLSQQSWQSITAQSERHAKERSDQFQRFEATMDKLMERNSQDMRGLIAEMKTEFGELSEKIDGIKDKP